MTCFTCGKIRHKAFECRNKPKPVSDLVSEVDPAFSAFISVA